jgi:Restriction endonuclease
MDLHDELSALEREKNPRKRARRFEIFLVHLLENESFKVIHNSRTAHPRQTDLVAGRDQTFFIVEAKWTQRKTSVADIAQLRDRLSRVPPDMFACVFSMGGFAESALQDVNRDKSRDIYLFNNTEMWGIVDGSVSFQRLLDAKKESLRIHGISLLTEALPVPTGFQIRSESDVFLAENGHVKWLRSRTGHNDVIFSNEFLDCCGNFSNSVFSLELHPILETVRELKRLFNVLQNSVGVSGQGSFSIHQGGEGWFGFGFESFLSAVVNQEDRYRELKWDSYHHSEELAYFDRLENGGVLCLTSRQGTGRTYLHSTHLEIYFPGIPVDTSNVRRLCEAVKNPEAHLELVEKNPVQTCRLPLAIEVQPATAIVSNWHGGRSVSGLVVKNPLLTAEIRADVMDQCGQFWHSISKNEFLFCSLRHWHNVGQSMKRYRLTSISACRIERFCAFHLLCDWD